MSTHYELNPTHHRSLRQFLGVVCTLLLLALQAPLQQLLLGHCSESPSENLHTQSENKTTTRHWLLIQTWTEHIPSDRTRFQKIGKKRDKLKLSQVSDVLNSPNIPSSPPSPPTFFSGTTPQYTTAILSTYCSEANTIQTLYRGLIHYFYLVHILQWSKHDTDTIQRSNTLLLSCPYTAVKQTRYRHYTEV